MQTWLTMSPVSFNSNVHGKPSLQRLGTGNIAMFSPHSSCSLVELLVPPLLKKILGGGARPALVSIIPHHITYWQPTTILQRGADKSTFIHEEFSNMLSKSDLVFVHNRNQQKHRTYNTSLMTIILFTPGPNWSLNILLTDSGNNFFHEQRSPRVAAQTRNNMSKA
jgi:hypothetical protein